MTHTRLGLLATASLWLLLSSCGEAGDTLSKETASEQGWPWGLSVDAGTVTCDKGISSAQIGFRAEGSGTTHALSSNAIADARARPGSTDFVYAQLGDIWDGTSPFRPFLNAAWRRCGYQDGAPEHEARQVMGNAYQPR